MIWWVAPSKLSLVVLLSDGRHIRRRIVRRIGHVVVYVAQLRSPLYTIVRLDRRTPREATVAIVGIYADSAASITWYALVRYYICGVGNLRRPTVQYFIRFDILPKQRSVLAHLIFKRLARYGTCAQNIRIPPVVLLEHLHCHCYLVEIAGAVIFICLLLDCRHHRKDNRCQYCDYCDDRQQFDQ